MGRIVVTGASGFVGRRVVERLTTGNEIWCLSRNPGTNTENVHWIHYDLVTAGLPENMPSSADAVIHMAQSSRFRDFPTGVEDIFAVNTAATARLAEWACLNDVKVFVYVSTGGIYGSSEEPLTEDHPFRSSGSLAFYQASKYAAEIVLKAWEQRFTVVVLRPFFIYGPGQRQEMLIPRLINLIRQGKPIQLQPPEGMRCNPIHVDDMAVAVEQAIDLERSIAINVAGPTVLGLEEITRIIGENCGIEPMVEMLKGKSPEHMVADISRMREILGGPRISFSDGIARWLHSEASDLSEGMD